MNPPSTLRAGDSASWSEDLASYSAADGWALKYRIMWRTAGPAAVNITASGSGITHTATLTSATTAGFAAGMATLASWVERGAERVTLAQRNLQILPDLTAANSHDSRSQNQKALDDAKAALADYIAGGQMKVVRYTIDNRSMEFRSAQDLRDLIAHYEREVFKENALHAAASGIAAGRVITRM